MHAPGLQEGTSHPDDWLHVVLYQPQIPQNTGNIGRTCVALRARLWIVRPTAFRLDASHLRRAGLDYWDHLHWSAVDSWSEISQRFPPEKMWLVTKFGSVKYCDASFAQGDALVFGSETDGLPESMRERHPMSRQISLPMPGPVRSLNLATAAGIVMYEAYRQVEHLRGNTDGEAEAG